MRCRICRNEEQNTPYRAREMMLGLRHEFDYFQCAACGCLQIAEFPPDMTPYYPPHYIGFGRVKFRGVEAPGWAVTMWDFSEVEPLYLERQASGMSAETTYNAFAGALTEKAVARYFPDVKRDARILDVGCGSGEFIYFMREIGFANVTGVDLFIEKDIEYSNGVKVTKGTIHDLDSTWDLIMMHHVLEHVSDPLETLQAVAQHLSPEGVCLVRIPISSSYAWEHYRTNWIQLDAPRHFFLFSVQSLERIVQQVGLRLDRTLYDSLGGALAISSLYQRGISIPEIAEDLFSPEYLRPFIEQAASLNEGKRGDQAAFYLRH